MGQLDPDIVGAMLGPILGIPGVIVFTALISRFKLKKKELDMRGSDPELGPVVDELRDDLNDTRAQLADHCRNASTSQSVCSPPGVRRKRNEVGDRLTGRRSSDVGRALRGPASIGSSHTSRRHCSASPRFTSA